MAAKHGAEKKEQGNEALAAKIREQIDAIVAMNEAVGAETDLAPIVDGPDFAALSDAEKNDVLAWAKSKGYVKEKPEAREPRERKEPKRREFLGYRFDVRDGKPTIVEDYQEWDGRAGEYVKKATDTSIELPDTLAARMMNDAELRDRVLGECEKLHNEINRHTNLYFDEDKDAPNRLRPKWKSGLRSALVVNYPQVDTKTLAQQTEIDPALIPADVFAQVKAALEKNKAADDDGSKEAYYKKPPYSKWLGRAKQRRREQVISAQISEKSWGGQPSAEVEPLAETPAPPLEAAAEPKEKPPTPRPPEREITEADLAEVATAFIEKLAPKFHDLPAETGELVDLVTQFTRNTVEYRGRHQGIMEQQALPDDMVNRAIADAMLAHFAAAPEIQAEVRRIFNPDVHEAAPSTNAMLVNLRAQAAELRTAEDRAQFIFSLEEAKKTGIAPLAEAADAMLAELNEEAPDRSLKEIVEEAAADLHISDATRKKIVEYLSKVAAPWVGTDISRRFRDEIAEFDGDTGELHIHDLGKLKTVIGTLAKSLGEK